MTDTDAILSIYHYFLKCGTKLYRDNKYKRFGIFDRVRDIDKNPQYKIEAILNKYNNSTIQAPADEKYLLVNTLYYMFIYRELKYFGKGNKDFTANEKTHPKNKNPSFDLLERTLKFINKYRNNNTK